jgi:hypothetical protein
MAARVMPSSRSIDALNMSPSWAGSWSKRGSVDANIASTMSASIGGTSQRAE